MQPDPEIYRQQFCRRLTEMHHEPDLHPADFVIRSSEGTDFPVHRCILATHSPVFAAMLAHDSTEKKQALCELDDIDGESVDILCDYVYGCELGKVNRDNAEKILITADKYDVADLRAFCERLLASTLTVEKAARYLALAEQRGLGTLMEEALFLLKTHRTRKYTTGNHEVPANACHCGPNTSKEDGRTLTLAPTGAGFLAVAIGSGALAIFCAKISRIF
ncbi:speckle-type POZ protein-like [Paramacrobiotus metropolitanus]|uniref:speckle-type POZ protein-like n=1 Tax=Paramacrobiotus metropolitanus TaxID=2943436 RepID=UPI0024461DB7|nr:speckle-type POZ protein-like [Paramacrobiotus metropolitanus]